MEATGSARYGEGVEIPLVLNERFFGRPHRMVVETKTLY
jgi:hypothetical protein